jgi:hypothetical protein
MSKKLSKRGRPATGRRSDLASISLRLESDLLRQIDETAARVGERTGRHFTRTAYIKNVLRDEVDAEQDIRPDLREIMALCLKITERAEAFAGQEWHENSFIPATITLALQGVLAHFGGKGPAVAPEKLKELALEGQAAPTTAEEVARIVQFMVIAELEAAARREYEANPGMFLKLAHRNRRLPSGKQTVIPSQWAKHSQMQRGLRSARTKKN